MVPEPAPSYSFTTLVLLITIATIFLWVIIREIVNYICLKRLESYGVKTYYYPIIGALRLGVFNFSSDTLLPYKQLNGENCKEKAIASNWPIRIGRRWINLLNPKTIQKFLAVETQVSYREGVLGYMNAGFFFKETAEALKEKSIFTEFFKYETQIQFNEPVFNAAARVLKDVTHHNKINFDYKTIDILGIMKEFMIQFSNYTIFGVREGEGIPKLYDGTEITLAVEEYFELVFRGYCNPLHALTFGLYTNLGITKSQRRKNYLEKELHRSIISEYETRKTEYLSTTEHTRMDNMLDIMIKHNLKAKKEGKTEDILGEKNIVGNVCFFYLAGYNTSVDSMTSGMTFIAERPDWVKRCVDEGLKSPQEILNNKSLECLIKEILRLCPPIPLALPRKIIKDCEVDGIKLWKGDNVTFPHGGYSMDLEYFDEPLKFTPERFLDGEKLAKNPKQANIPFSLGKRSCLGKELAYNEVRIFIGSLLREYEIKTPENYVRSYVLSWGYRVANAFVDAKLREKIY